MERLKNRSVIVTGAARGIGRAISLLFAREGANLTLNSRQSPLGELEGELRRIGAQTLALIGDVSESAFADRIIEQTQETFGSVDVLINNAGITSDKLLIRMKDEEFDEVIRVNLRGAFNMTRASARVMSRRRSGSIVNISSVVGQIGNIGQSNYAASKAGLIGLTKSTARELASRSVRVNAIAPGFIETDMTAQLKESIKDQLAASIPLGRFGSAEEIASAALFLASDEASYITGATISVNGGLAL